MTNQEYCETMLSYGYALKFEAQINKAECGTLVATRKTKTLSDAECMVSRYNQINGMKANLCIKVGL